VARHKEYYKGEGGGFPPCPGYGESYEFVFICGSSMHQRCSNYALTNLFSLCKSMLIINMLTICPSPRFGAPTHPSTLEMLRAKKCTPTPYPSIVFIFGLVVESIKKFGGVSLHHFYNWILFIFYSTWFYIVVISTIVCIMFTSLSCFHMWFQCCYRFANMWY